LGLNVKKNEKKMGFRMLTAQQSIVNLAKEYK